MYVFLTGDHMAGQEGGGGWVEQYCKLKINRNLYLAVLFACLLLFLFCSMFEAIYSCVCKYDTVPLPLHAKPALPFSHCMR